MFNLDAFQWLLVSLCAFCIGLNKTGIPGVAILAIPLMAEVIPARASTGVVLPMLVFADIFAVTYYRRRVVWSYLIRLLPWTVVGVVLGFLALGRINDEQLKPFIGIVVLIMLGINHWWISLERGKTQIPTRWWFAAGLGLVAGATTMMANAAGPIVVIYLSAMRLPKVEFISTGAWFYLLLNWFKIPFSVDLGLMTIQSLQFDLVLFPMIAAGALTGIKVFKHIPEKTFSNVVQMLAAAAAISLLL